MDDPGSFENPAPRKIAIISGTIVLLVALVLIYDSRKSSCESIFQQTSSQLRLKLKTIAAEGEVLIGQVKIQELTEKAQQTAVSLKTCCAVLEAGKVDAERFLRCKNQAQGCVQGLDRIIVRLREAKAAEREGGSETVAEKVRQIDRTIVEVTGIADRLEREVAGLQPMPAVAAGDRQAASACDSLISPSAPLPVGGSSFEEAPALAPGRYRLTMNPTRSLYYRMYLRAGQTLRIRFRTPDTYPNSSSGASVYDADGKLLQRAASIRISSTEELTFEAETDGIRYLSVGNYGAIKAGKGGRLLLRGLIEGSGRQAATSPGRLAFATSRPVQRGRPPSSGGQIARSSGELEVS